MDTPGLFLFFLEFSLAWASACSAERQHALPSTLSENLGTSEAEKPSTLNSTYSFCTQLKPVPYTSTVSQTSSYPQPSNPQNLQTDLNHEKPSNPSLPLKKNKPAQQPSTLNPSKPRVPSFPAPACCPPEGPELQSSPSRDSWAEKVPSSQKPLYCRVRIGFRPVSF